jgi:A/G-specific adenine glycosylase
MSERPEKLIQNLQYWYQLHHRKLPFRHEITPYKVWVSEVMLQQTQVETMIPYYHKFLDKYPDVLTLAQSNLDEILTVVQGIGYYRRFKLMYQGAKYIINHHSGKFPTNYKDIRAIPGVGEYTAGAIMSIVYNAPYAATDGNVIRVLSRIYGLQEDMSLTKNRKKVMQLNQDLMRDSEPRIFSQALMELGATICRPQQVKCTECPVRDMCFSYKNDKVTDIPFIGAKAPIKYKEFYTLIVTNGAGILLEKNQESLLNSMMMLPQTDKSDDQSLIDLYQLDVSEQNFFGDYKHRFTHQEWLMHVMIVKVTKKPSHHQFIKFNELENIPIPEAHKKILKDWLKIKHSKNIHL